MAEKIPTLPPDTLTHTEVYQPLSKLALAGLAVAVGYAVVIGVLTVVAFFTGVPLFLRIETLAIPAVGAALAYAGRQQIRGSEGVLSGTALTTWALWLCGLCGLGYAAYYFGTYFAVTLQAGNFTRAWLDKVRAGKTVEAFLDTQEPARRKNDKPSDLDYMFQFYGTGPMGRKGLLPLFLESSNLKVLQEAATSGELKSLGVKDWEYSNKGYKVEELYQARTPEGTYEMLIVVRGTQGPEFEGRQWQVAWENVRFDNPKLTELGKVLADWQPSARQFGSSWVTLRNQRDLAGAYLDTLPPDQRPSVSRALNHQLLLAGLSQAPLADVGGPISRFVRLGVLGNTEALSLSLLPGFREFADGGLVHADQLLATRAVREDLVRSVKQNFLDPALVRLQPQTTAGRTYPVNRDQGVYRVLLDMDVTVSAPGTANAAGPPRYRADAYLVVESDPGPVTPQRKPVWRVAALQLARGVPATEPAGPAGPGRPTAPPPPAGAGR